MKLSSEAGAEEGRWCPSPPKPTGEVRLAYADNNDEATLKRFADDHVATEAAITTEGLATYNRRKTVSAGRQCGGLSTKPCRAALSGAIGIGLIRWREDFVQKASFVKSVLS
jgi:hypothetical protein